jgi:hypothetical protein
MIAKQFAVLRLEHYGVSLEKRKQQEKEIILSPILQIVKNQIYFSINTKRADSCESAQLFKKVL